jgi:AraC-like DNA-binding protein
MKKLAREGLLVLDPVVESALRGRAQELSPRSVQRRVLRATGLTQATIRQIERAETAVALLEQGTSIAEVVRLARFADQAHLTRALKRFIGQTPGEVAHAH